MAKARGTSGFGTVAPAIFAVALFAVPTAGLALAGLDAGLGRPSAVQATPFTPAKADPELARRVQDRIAARSQAIRFTPAGTIADGQSTVTVAVRVDGDTARAISVRSALAGVQGEAGTRSVVLSGTRYNLGIARGYQSFAKPQSASVSQGLRDMGVRDMAMPDLAQFKPSEGAADKPSRFQPRIALETEETKGRARGTLEGLGDQSLDVGGAYRVTRNLNVTAGVRLSQERDRLAPLSDGLEDDKAVYVGTQFRF
ncbi:MAG: hypothetical protein ACK4GD_10005 [Sphingomonadaceae bacterium]